MNRLVKNYIYNVLYQIFLIVVPLITAPYLTRTLSSSALGVYDYINSVISIITTFGLIGLQSYGYRQIAYFRDNKVAVDKEFSSIYFLRIIIFVIISCIYLPLSSRSPYSRFYFIQYALIAAQFLDISWVFIGFEDLKIVSLRNFWAKCLTVVRIFLFVKSDDELWVYFALFAFITLITALSVYPVMAKYVSFSKVKIEEIVSHIGGSIKLFIPQVATILYMQFDKIMLKGITGSTEQVAYYSYAEKIINIPLAVITALGTVMMPRLANLYSNNEKKAIENYLIKTIQFALFLAIPMMLGLSAIADGFIPWYLGTEYSISAKIIIVLSPICIFNALSNILGAQYLTAVNKTKELTIAYYCAALTNIIINAILIPKLKCTGAALATVFCSFISVIVQMYFVRKEISFKGIAKNIIKILVSSICMTIIIVLIKTLLKVSVLATFLEILIGCLCYGGMVILLKEENVIFIMNIILKRTGLKK